MWRARIRDDKVHDRLMRGDSVPRAGATLNARHLEVVAKTPAGMVDACGNTWSGWPKRRRKLA